MRLLIFSPAVTINQVRWCPCPGLSPPECFLYKYTDWVGEQSVRDIFGLDWLCISGTDQPKISLACKIYVW